MSTKELPIGYLRCMECGGPALWLIDGVSYEQIPDDVEDIKISIKYRLVNLKHTEYDPEALNYYICDSCGCKIYTDNYNGDNIVFLDNIDTPKIAQ